MSTATLLPDSREILVTIAGERLYLIELEEIDSLEDMMSRVFHVSALVGVTRATVGAVVQALDLLFDAPNNFIYSANPEEAKLHMRKTCALLSFNKSINLQRKGGKLWGW